MSGSVTPARRRREEDESDEEDYEVSIDGEVRSSGSKRARLDDGVDREDEKDDDEEEVETRAFHP